MPASKNMPTRSILPWWAFSTKDAAVNGTFILASAARAALAFLSQAVIASVKLSSMKKIDFRHISELECGDVDGDHIVHRFMHLLECSIESLIPPVQSGLVERPLIEPQRLRDPGLCLGVQVAALEHFQSIVQFGDYQPD